jgi:hypothetical protein
MKVKIIKTPHTERWYPEIIGKEFIVQDYKYDDTRYKITEGFQTGSLIYKSDCEIIEDKA